MDDAWGRADDFDKKMVRSLRSAANRIIYIGLVDYFRLTRNLKKK